MSFRSVSPPSIPSFYRKQDNEKTHENKEAIVQGLKRDSTFDNIKNDLVGLEILID